MPLYAGPVVLTGKDLPTSLCATMFSLLGNFLQDFCFKMEHFGAPSIGAAVLGEERGSSCFTYVEIRAVPHPQAGLQTSSVFTFGKGGREGCLQVSVLVCLPSSLLGCTDFVLAVGWAARHRPEEAFLLGRTRCLEAGGGCCCCYNC